MLVGNEWIVYVEGGRTPTKLKTVEWAKNAWKLGAGEILLTSMNTDGTKLGFSKDIIRMVTDSVNIPVIASGGAGSMEHFRDVFISTGCSAALAASIFHFREVSIPDLKKYLLKEKIHVRL
jgi:cyclase